MKLEYDSVRKLLLQIEESYSPEGGDLTFGSNTEPDRYYAAKKLTEARFLKSYELFDSDDNQSLITVQEMTYWGHQFLESIRSDSVWAQVKSKISESGVSISISTIEKVAGKLIDSLLS